VDEIFAPGFAFVNEGIPGKITPFYIGWPTRLFGQISKPTTRYRLKAGRYRPKAGRFVVNLTSVRWEAIKATSPESGRFVG
jgi:hypothetical protein